MKVKTELIISDLEFTENNPLRDEPEASLADPQPAFPAPSEPEKPTLRRLFFGDDGLRAGWSVLLFLVLVGVFIALTALAIKHFHLLPKPAKMKPDEQAVMRPRVSTIGELLQFCGFAVPALIMALIERRPFARYGLALRRALPDFVAGLFWGFTAMSALVGALLLTHGIAFEGFLLHGTVALLYALKWGLVFLLVGLAEEFLFRGYLQYTVARGVAGIMRATSSSTRDPHAISFWITAFLFSICLFALAHTGNGGENAIGLLQVALAGTVFAFSLYRTGTLWWAIGLHTAWDWAQSYFYGTPDSGNLAVGHLLASHPVGSRLLSGGPDGPEGSLLGIPALLLVGLVIHLTLPKRNYPVTPDQVPDAHAPGGGLAEAGSAVL